MTVMSAATGTPAIAKISPDAPWAWLGAGWRDMLRAPFLSLGYGAAFVVIGLAITAGLWRAGLESVIPAAIGAFALVGPLLAAGLYEISRRLEAGESLNARDIIFVKMRSPAQMALIAFFLMFAVLVWMRMATLIYALFAHGSYLPLGEFIPFTLTTRAGVMMLAVGSLTGGAIAFVIYVLTALSMPLLMDREADAFTAIALSVEAVKKNPGAMLLWAWIIAVVTAVGIALFLVGLIVAFPLLGHATWRAYRDLAGAA
ncbi:MAG: DUF2189 domain-containing protein [Parvularculaceae bacterium]